MPFRPIEAEIWNSLIFCLLLIFQLAPPDFCLLLIFVSSWFFSRPDFCLVLIFVSSIFLPSSEFCSSLNFCLFLIFASSGFLPSPIFCLLFNFHLIDLFLWFLASCWHCIINPHHISADHSDSPTKSFRSCFWNKEIFMLIKVEMIRWEAKEWVILDYFIHQLCPKIVTAST